MIRKIVVAALCLIPVVGQAQTVEHFGLASQFNNWRANAQSGPYSNTTLVAGANTVSVNPCQVQGDPNHTIPVFAASTPVRIVDLGTPSLSETVTPSTVSNGGCTATFTTTNAHGSNFYFTSGTFGLGEAINAYAQSAALNEIELDSVWHSAGGGAATIYAITAGSPYLTIQDVSIAPAVAYRWNGTHYVANYAVNGIYSALTPTAGAAAGTGATVVNSPASSGNSMTLVLTTGTATSTGTFFQEYTSVATPGGGNLNCVATSVGPNISPAIGLFTTTQLQTYTVGFAPPASTQYIYNITCN